MTNYAILSKIKEKQVLAWDDLDKVAPYKELDLLRALDQIEKGEHHLTETAISGLYTMLAFQRLVRHKNSDELVDVLLDKAATYDDTVPVYQSLVTVKNYLSIYFHLQQIDFHTWSIRETDFDSAKRNKLTDWQSQIASYHDATRSIRLKKKESKLETIYFQLKEALLVLEEEMETALKLIEAKRTGVPTKEINKTIQAIVKLQHEFYENFPKALNADVQRSPLDQLEDMIGLEEIKQYMKQYYSYLKYQQDRKKIGFQMIDDPGLHMIITGNPGTGKTTISRLLADIYHELGLLESNRVIEVNRSHLIGSYVGQSEENTINYIKQAVGGVLFIDEAYSLRRQDQSGNDYGQAVIDTLVSAMTSGEYANKFAVILAGYPEETRQFLWSNPGLRSRFPDQNMMELPDFEINELVQIAENTALQNDYYFTETARNSLSGLIERAKVDDTFGNARTVRDLVMKAIFSKGASETVGANDNWLEHMRIESKDLAVIDDDKDSTDPMGQLDQLIGLNNIKDEVKKLSSFVRVQQHRKAQGYPTVPIQLHAVFSGHPGTGKTTVAKIYSRLLKECGLLKRGHFILASRSDLVAGYVGQTAIKTKQKIREALGGVLFIDEAYALFRGENDFGKEAIDTLVDEMTKHNENLVVILAGYQQEMERFIQSNPGLSSRFKKYFTFLDYTAEELIEITLYHIERYHYSLDEAAKDYLLQQFSRQSIKGNARFVVNLVEEAIQFQALRIDQQVNEQEFVRINKEDVTKAWLAVKGD